MSEVITLQFGNYANYVGAHWWNIQEFGFEYDSNAAPSAINHDVLYREGHNTMGHVTYTPRLLLVDQKGCLKHMSANGDLYTDESVDLLVPADNLWDMGDLEVVKQEPAKKSQYQMDLVASGGGSATGSDYKFSETVETWTDYLYSRYHPRSINIINDLEHSSTEDTFDCFTAGTQLWNTDYFQNEYVDNVRQYMEECNRCQGFQTVFDCTNGFSGLTVKCLEYLNDEYSKACLAIPIFAPVAPVFRNADTAMSDSIRVINIAMTYHNLIEQSAMILPLSTMNQSWRQIAKPRHFPHYSFKPNNLYETSAILATYLDTMTLPYRLKEGGSSISGFCSDLTNYGRKLTAAALALPYRMGADELLIECLDKQDLSSMFTQLSPNSKLGTDKIVQMVSVRGIAEDRIKRPLEKAKDQIRMAAYKCGSAREMFELFFQCNMYASLTHVTSCANGMPIKTPFPMEAFDERIGSDGFLDDFARPKDIGINSVPVLAAAQSSADIADTIESLHREVARIKIAKIHRFKETGFEDDEFAEMLNALLEFKDNYDETFDM